jgi:hypothetical protein
MHLASGYIHPYKDVGGRLSHCRVRIYLPDDVLDAPVVVCSEVPIIRERRWQAATTGS